MMANVWIVEQGEDHEGSDIYGVFDTEERAHASVRRILEKDRKDETDYYRWKHISKSRWERCGCWMTIKPYDVCTETEISE